MGSRTVYNMSYCNLNSPPPPPNKKNLLKTEFSGWLAKFTSLEVSDTNSLHADYQSVCNEATPDNSSACFQMHTSLRKCLTSYSERFSVVSRLILRGVYHIIIYLLMHT